MGGQTDRSAWFPFTESELQMAFAVYGLVISILGFVGFDSRSLLAATAAFGCLAYVAGLLVYARVGRSHLVFLRGGAVGGHGYAESFRRVKRCLYLMHVDDDAPGDELLALYRTLLNRGVQIRRTVFLRPDADPASYEWILRFGDHANLQQRVVLPDQAAVMRHGFAVVDDSLVLLSVPGHEAIDGHPYLEKLILRHLLLIDDQQVAAAFLRVHEEIWQRALPLGDVAQLEGPEQLLLMARQ